VLTLRARLTLWYSGLLLAALLVFTVLVLWAEWRLQVSGTDRALDGVTLTASNMIAEEMGEHAQLAGAAREASGVVRAEGLMVMVFDQDGRALTDTPPALDLDEIRQLGGRPPRTMRGHDGSAWRVSLRRSQVNGHEYLLGAAASLDDEQRQWRALARDASIGLVVVMVIAGAGGWLLGRHGLRPLTSMALHAREITSDKPAIRLPVPASGDELTHVGESFNRVLDRLGHALEEQRRFMADASHELRTPVSTIRTAIDVTLSRPGRDAAEYREALESMVQQTARLARLVDDMLVLARADAGGYRAVFTDIDLGDLAADCVRELAILTEGRGVRLASHIARGTFIHADETLLRRLLVNLLSNAIAHTPDNGAIRVSAGISGDFCEIHVADSGAGIAPEDRERIFGRFVRLNPAREAGGSGLGLAIARWIAEVHGGTVWVAVSSSRGTTFTARFLHGDALA
jgi:heavy metal sensor kinase